MRTLVTLTLASAIAATAALAGAAPAAFEDSTILIVARNGADNPPGDNRRGRGGDDAANRASPARADNPPGDNRRGRGADDPAGRVRPARADDPAGDMRRGRGRGGDDPANHG